jgi:3-hydroxyacyl-CoA dehydrogenase
MTQAQLAQEIETAAQNKQVDIVLEMLPYLGRFRGHLNRYVSLEIGLDIATDILMTQTPQHFLPYLFTAMLHRKFTAWKVTEKTKQCVYGYYKTELENRQNIANEIDEARRTLITISVALARLNKRRKHLTKAQVLAQIGIDYVLAGCEWQDAITLAIGLTRR